ncbi:MAG: EamA family transporter [Candidatus Omnitrophota bacterium]
MKQNLILIISLIFVTDICDTVSQLLLKSSINSLDLHINTIKKVIRLMVQLIKTPRVLIGFFFSALSLSIWLVVLTKADLNFAFSIDSMRYILIALASVLILKEKINTARWLGIFAVVCGIILVAIG